MAKKLVTKKQEEVIKESPKKETSLFDYLRLGESYTSLVLGIIVVIIGTALLLSFVHNKNAGTVNAPITQQTQNTVQANQQALELEKKAPGDIDGAVAIAPTATRAPTVIPTSVLTVAPVKPTTKPTIQPTVKANPTPTNIPQVKKVNNVKDKSVWIVQKNESLWLIAEKKYTSGYNWVDIATANHLANPSDIHVGDRLILPTVEAKLATISPKEVNRVSSMQKATRMNTDTMSKISSDSYTVVHGDNLWNIAVRAYGDGYKWTDIANANNLVNPSIIHSGNHLKIPRN